MARVHFTPNLRRHLDAASMDAPPGTLRETLEGVFEANPQVRSYVVDDQGRLRAHVAVYVDGNPVRDRVRLGDAVAGGSEVHVMQALSGG